MACGLVLLLGVVLGHFPHDREPGFDLASDHPVVVVLRLVDIPFIVVLQGQVVIGVHLPFDALHQPSQLELLLEAEDGFLVVFQLLVAFPQLLVGVHLRLIVLVFLGGVSEALEALDGFPWVPTRVAQVDEGQDVHRLLE